MFTRTRDGRTITVDKEVVAWDEDGQPLVLFGRALVTPIGLISEGYTLARVQQVPVVTGVLPGGGWRVRYHQQYNDGVYTHTEPVVAWHTLSDGTTVPLMAPTHGEEDGVWCVNEVERDGDVSLVHPDGTEQDRGDVLAAFMEWCGKCESSARRYRIIDGVDQRCPDCHIDHPANRGRQRELAQALEKKLTAQAD
ncbi:hypothetical protein [Streptomyces roseicoloratus]|uniref:hypothetical protein n=1 Tax=Streptomyces roseicoloratus TaxID=2508722 RepID=UPI001009D19F|nr:hypothetical protein [Streptomyces roseicoloratus]